MPDTRYSFGLKCLIALRQFEQIRFDPDYHTEETPAGTRITELATGRQCLYDGSDHPTALLGAVCGDVAGSVYEGHNIKYVPDRARILSRHSRFTDDSALTAAVAEGLRNALGPIGKADAAGGAYDGDILKAVSRSLIRFGNAYPRAGYGSAFKSWLYSEDHAVRVSMGNGAAMRVSYAGWVANSLEEARRFAALQATPTHNHPEAHKAAEAIAGMIFLLKTGHTKDEAARYAKTFYPLDFTLDGIRASYRFRSVCPDSVPQAIEAFLEGEDFLDVIAKAISIGGDSDTIAAIAGGIAETVYPIPQSFRGRVISRLDPYIRNSLIDSIDFAAGRAGLSIAAAGEK